MKMRLFQRKCSIPVDMRKLLEFIDARFDKLNIRILRIMEQLMANLATANAEIKDRKAELALVKTDLATAMAKIAELEAAAGILPAGAMSADQVASAIAASADLVVAAAP